MLNTFFYVGDETFCRGTSPPCAPMVTGLHRSRITDEHLHSILWVSSAQTLTQNIDELVHKIRHHVTSIWVRQVSISEQAG